MVKTKVFDVITGIETEEYKEIYINVPTIEEIDLNRKIAYHLEADPLFFKYQRGEVTKEEWLNKIQEIKDKYPKNTQP